MGVEQSWLRTDGKAGSVDLAILANEEKTTIKSISFRTLSRLWYTLSPLDDTELQSESGIITPVHLEFDPWARMNGGFIEEAGLALRSIKQWATERRHFPNAGEVTIANAIIREGDPLVINGRETSPVDVAWVTEFVDLSEASIITWHSDTDPGTGEKEYAHF
jgi:hypothetical protein